MPKFIEEIKKAVENCKRCKNERYITRSDGTREQCLCYADVIFLERLEDAKVDIDKIDLEKARRLKTTFQKKTLIATNCSQILERDKWIYSAAFLGTRYGFKTSMFNDQNLVSTVFNKEGMEEGADQLSRFIDPQFLVFEIATIPNKQFIGAFILRILRDREALKRPTFVIYPDLTTVSDKYDDSDLNDYLSDIKTYQKDIGGKQ